MFVLNAEIIERAMKSLGLRSLSALAERVGMHRNSLARYLSGKEPVLPHSVSRMLDELGLKPGEAIVKIKAETETGRTEPVSELVDALVVAHPRAAYVLFGSRARGRGKAYSDFDLGVYSRDELKLPAYLRLLELKEQAESQSPYFVDLVNLNGADPGFLRSIAPDLTLLGGRHGDWLALKSRCMQ